MNSDRAPVIRVESLGRTYDSPAGQVLALADATFDVHSGEVVSLVGPSGSGKSTLMNMLGLLDRPTTGHYLLNGRDTAQLDERERTRLRAVSIGFVFQAFHLVAHKTARSNVVLPLMYTGCPRQERRKIAEDQLRRVGLGHRLSAFPPTLSGGEKQRVAIARATVHKPAILLADEPTGNLDLTTSASVMELLGDLARSGLAVVVVTHDQAVAAASDRVLTVSDGRVRTLDRHG